MVRRLWIILSLAVTTTIGHALACLRSTLFLTPTVDAWIAEYPEPPHAHNGEATALPGESQQVAARPRGPGPRIVRAQARDGTLVGALPSARVVRTGHPRRPA